jgi:hypothetical protein
MAKDRKGGLVLVFTENEVAPSIDYNYSNAEFAARNRELDSV